MQFQMKCRIVWHSIWVLTVCQSTRLGDSGLQWVNEIPKPPNRSIISRLSTSKIKIFYLVSVAEQIGLSKALLETQKTLFVVSRPI